jgi:hypothetical protein
MARTVKIQVFGVAEGWAQGLALESTDYAVRSALQAAGWNVVSVNLSGSGIGSTRYGEWLDIYVNVDDQFSQADIERNIVTDLAGTFGVSQVSVNDPNATGMHTTNTGASGLPPVDGKGGLFGENPLGDSTTSTLLFGAVALIAVVILLEKK